MIGYIVAMQKEAKELLKIMDIQKEQVIAGKKFYIGELFGKPSIICVSGIGKVNAALTTQLLIDKFAPKVVVNFGVAGGKENSGLNMGDFVLLNKICQYDFDLSEIDDVSIGYMQDYDTIYYDTACNLYKGKNFALCLGASGDRFTNNPYFLNIIKDLGAHVVDMESGAIAQVCKTNNIHLLAVKLISDVDGKEGSIFDQYEGNVVALSAKFPLVLEELVNNIDI